MKDIRNFNEFHGGTLPKCRQLFLPDERARQIHTKYSLSAIIPKSDTKTLQAIEEAIKAAYEEGEGKLKGNNKVAPALSSIKSPLRDGDTDRAGDPAYANAYFIVEEFYQLFKPEIKESRKNHNMDALYQKIGYENFEALA